jgi:hypothetical protein
MPVKAIAPGVRSSFLMKLTVVVLLGASLVACATSGTRTPRQNGSGDLPFPPHVAVFGLVLKGGKADSVAGVVTDLRSLTGPADGVSRKDEAFIRDASGIVRVLEIVATPRALRLPFAVGDLIRVEVRCSGASATLVCAHVVYDSANRLIILSGDRRDPVVPGFAVEPGPVVAEADGAPGTRAITRTLLFTIGGERVIAPAMQWGRVSAYGARFLVWGSDVSWEGRNTPPSMVYAIVLERRPGALTS